MNGRFDDNARLLQALVAQDGVAGIERLVCVPFPYLLQAREALRGASVALGAQDVSQHAEGAFTGDVSASMLADCGCSHVLVGHSERRARHHESDTLVASKAVAALDAGLVPVVCVGETLAERDEGVVEVVLERQLGAVLAAVPQERQAEIIVAYEPVWAIGTGRVAESDDVQDALAYLRSCLAPGEGDKVRILYGGSVGPTTAPALFDLPDCDGALVGGASLVAEQFMQICAAAQAASRK